MTCQRFHTVSRMRENCTYGSMRGRAYPAGASRPTLHPIDPAAKLANALKMDFFPDLRPHELTQKLPNMV